MKKNFKSILCIILTLALILPVFMLAACGGLTYDGKTLENGKVGKEYSQSVEATGSESITYALKSESTLPLGLSLSAGKITGVPRAKADAHKFTVVATAGGSTAEAEFTITIGSGAIAYEGNTALKASIGSAAEISLKTATDVVGSVTYTLKSGEMPDGLTFTNGIISGTPTTLGEEKTFTVTASANDHTPADATFKLTITEPAIGLTGATLAAGEIGFYYGKLLTATGVDADTVVNYTLKDGSTLPAGLTLDANGYINGTPTATVRSHTFKVIATADGYLTEEAEFVISITIENEPEMDGSIAYAAKTLPEGYVGSTYFVAEALKVNATAPNGATIRYNLANGSALPAGFELLENGDLRNLTGALAGGTFKFSVTASAARCTSVTTEFTLIIGAPKLNWSLIIEAPEATVTEAYSINIATATIPDGGSGTITYSVANASTMPQGLSLSENGVLSGTPTKSVRMANISVQASAEGYTTTISTVIMKIRDQMQTPQDNKFHIVYIDLSEAEGASWSSNPNGSDMILDSAETQSNEDIGYALGYLMRENVDVLNYEIYSSKVVNNASLYVRITTEVGNITLTPDIFEIVVNGTAINYGSFNLTGTPQLASPYTEFTVTLNALTLKQGPNNIGINIYQNNRAQDNMTAAPLFDYIRIANTDAVLTWSPHKYNLD